ncbi:MAG: restriction endonuclease [Schwartzia succinivorans]|nr:restriction endonuclease [Schwartzia succinivorans]
MNAEQLKNSILQRAIEGKLVEQREEEGTAAELLREIKAEKARLVKEGKLKKEKPLPEIKAEEIPFEIPKSWEWVRLGELLEVIGGVSYKKNEVKPEGIRVLRGGNIDSLCISFFDDDVFLSLDAIDSTKMLQMNDIIIVSSTGSKKVIGKPGFVKQAMPNTTIGAFLRICRLFNTSFVSYIQVIFASEYYRKHIRDSVQGTNINNMKQEHITHFIIPLPPLAEQKRIVAKIEELLPHVEQYGKAHEELTALNEKFPDAMKKSVLQYAMEGKLVKQREEEGTAKELLKEIKAEKARLVKEGKLKKEKPLPEIKAEEIPFEIPESWEWVRLTNICEAIVDCPHSTPTYLQEKTEFTGIDTNCIDANGRITGYRYVNQETYEKRIERLTPQGNDIVLTREGSIGRAAILPHGKKICLGQRVMLLRPPKCIDTTLLQLFLMAPDTLQRLTAQQKGLGAKHINVSDICKLSLPLPPLAEQKRIVAKIEELLSCCGALGNEPTA